MTPGSFADGGGVLLVFYNRTGETVTVKSLYDGMCDRRTKI